MADKYDDFMDETEARLAEIMEKVAHHAPMNKSPKKKSRK